MQPRTWLFLIPIHVLLTIAQADNATYLTATAIVTKNNYSAFECWQLTEPFKRSSTPGVSGTQVATIGNYTNFGYTILPARYDGGIHTAPVPQYGYSIARNRFGDLI